MLDNNIIRDEFPQAEGLKYLDHAAVAPWPKRTREAVVAFAHENITYGASRYHLFNEKEDHLRRQIKDLINAPSIDDIALLKNTSEAISVVASGIRWNKGDNVVTAAEEFPSNWIPWDAQKIYGVSLKKVDVRVPQPEQALIGACDERTRVLTVSSVQFSSGIRLDLELLGSFCKANSILFCVDAIQSIGAHSIDVQKIQADFAMADGHKWMLGPEGLALFYCSAAVRDELKLYQYGWHMTETPYTTIVDTWKPVDSAKRFEAGSNNMLGVYGLSASLSLFEELGMADIEAELGCRVCYLIDRLKELDRLRLITPLEPERRAGIVAFQVEGTDQRELHGRLRENNVICALRRDAIRFSPHFYTSGQIIDETLEVLTSNI